MRPQPVGRRLFLAGLAGCAGLIALGGGVPAAIRAWVEAPLGELTPSDGFHFYSVTGSIPRWDPATWHLTVDGLVERPQSLTLGQLQARPQVTVAADFHCVSGWSVSGVRWTGVRLADLLDAAGVGPGAGGLRFESADGAYTDFLDVTTARREEVILALGLGGARLSAERGAPARLVVPFYYGYKGVKWVRRISAVAAPGTGYWEARGYDPDARIRG
jgi:DMSO/TMAO reductase YedYZ molybdopterin-dependent catalytic subunit